MENKIKKEFLKYLNAIISQQSLKIRGNIVDENGNFYPKRSAFPIFKKYIQDFLKFNSEPRWIIIHGLRGVGKTTLLSQLFYEVLSDKDVEKLYISVDEPMRRFGASLWDIVEGYEILIGKRLEELNKKLFLFFDEVQYDKNWDSAIKTFYDRTKKIFILCTGSSALLLKKQIDANVSRRAYFEELYPMDFKEYIMLKFKKYPEKNLSEKIKGAIFNSKKSEDVFNKLSLLEKKVKEYWFGVDIFEIDRYLKYGTLPFSLKIKEEGVILNQLELMLQRIIYTDIPEITNFDRESLNKIYSLIYLLSESFEISLTKLSTILEISKDTLSLIFSSLENANLIQRIPPYGSPYKQVRKPYRYLFTSPAFRFFLLSGMESISNFENFKGKLLEDVVGMYFKKILRKYPNSSLTYDCAKEGANFIVKIKDKKIVIEVGYGKKQIKQALMTLKRITGDYGIVFSLDEEMNFKDNIVKIPIKYFLLI
ncbi:MAG TPA: ATP-binding protein [bacterium]|nr:ATP-binding protein [bacterium]HOM27780.1 ATP-binding protein [bacterium]